MTERSKIKLSRLRDIGWSLWDPIGLLEEGASWDTEPFADEYDSYLLHVASLVRDCTRRDEAIAYLIDIESDHMGLGFGLGIRERAVKTVDAICTYWEELKTRAPGTN